MTTLVRSTSTNAPPVAHEPPPQRYELRELLGRGGMGDVYAAWDHELRRHVAIKVLRDTDSDPRQVRRLLREARISAGLSHPAVVKVFDTGLQPDGRPFLVMERVEGVPLNAIARPVDPETVARWMAPVCDALHEAHAAGVIHRDIKPPNLLLQSSHGQTRVRVLDFGVAHIQSAEASVTRDGSFVGTALYCAPEQAEGRPVSPATDIYALGVVMFELLTGELPFAASTAAATLYLHVHRPAPDVRTVAPHVPKQLALIIDACLAKRPDHRPASAQQLGDALRAWLGDGSVAAPVLRHTRPASPLAEEDTLSQTAENSAVYAHDRHQTDERPGAREPVSPSSRLRWSAAAAAIVVLSAATAVFPWRAQPQGTGVESDSASSLNDARPAVRAHPASSASERVVRGSESITPPPAMLPAPRETQVSKRTLVDARTNSRTIAAGILSLARDSASTAAQAQPRRRVVPDRHDRGAANPEPITPAQPVDALREELRALQQSSEPTRTSTDALRDELRLLRGVTP